MVEADSAVLLLADKAFRVPDFALQSKIRGGPDQRVAAARLSNNPLFALHTFACADESEIGPCGNCFQ